MQLSTFTKVTSIPKEESYKDFPVAVRVKAPEMTFHEHALVDIVAVIDVSGTMGWNYVNGSAVPNHRLELVKEAMKKVIENLGGAQNRLAVVPFSDKVIEAGVTPLTEMTKEGQQRVQKTVDGLKPGGGTAFRAPLQKAAQVNMEIWISFRSIFYYLSNVDYKISKYFDRQYSLTFVIINEMFLLEHMYLIRIF